MLTSVLIFLPSHDHHHHLQSDVDVLSAIDSALADPLARRPRGDILEITLEARRPIERAPHLLDDGNGNVLGGQSRRLRGKKDKSGCQRQGKPDTSQKRHRPILAQPPRFAKCNGRDNAALYR